MTGQDTTWVLVAKIVGAHGIKGAVRLRCFTEDVYALKNYSPLKSDSDQFFDVTPLHEKGEMLVVMLSNIKDRNQAEALKGTMLYADRSRFEALSEEEFYVTDLVGLSVYVNGQIVGRVQAIQNYGAGDMVVVCYDTGEEIIIPFTKEAVPDINFSDKFITVAPEIIKIFSEKK